MASRWGHWRPRLAGRGVLLRNHSPCSLLTDRPAEPPGRAASPQPSSATARRPRGACQGGGAAERRPCAPAGGQPGGCRCGHGRGGTAGLRGWGPGGATAVPQGPGPRDQELSCLSFPMCNIGVRDHSVLGCWGFNQRCSQAEGHSISASFTLKHPASRVTARPSRPPGPACQLSVPEEREGPGRAKGRGLHGHTADGCVLLLHQPEGRHQVEAWVGQGGETQGQRGEGGAGGGREREAGVRAEQERPRTPKARS